MRLGLRAMGAIRLGLVLLCAVVVALPAFAAEVPVVSNLRVGKHPDKVRIVLDVDQRVDVSIFLLPDPYRIVIDVPEVSFRLPEAAGSRAVGPVAGWRYGQFRAGTSRVVIDPPRFPAARSTGTAADIRRPPDHRDRCRPWRRRSRRDRSGRRA